MSFMSRQKGSLLIFVMWVLMIVSVLSVAVGSIVRQQLSFIRRIEERSALRDIASAGVKKAIYVLNQKRVSSPAPDTWKDTWHHNPVAFEKIQLGNGFFSVQHEANDTTYFGMEDEESKIHLGEVGSSAILTRFFQFAGNLRREEAHDIALSLLDWIDEDEHPYDGGAEKKHYLRLRPPYEPKNAPLNVLEELLAVKGVTPEIYERVKPFVTLYGSGKVNLNTASKEVLKAIGMDSTLVGKIDFYRNGADGLARTADDHIFIGLESVVGNLNLIIPLDDNEMASLTDYVESGLFRVTSTTYKIQSVSHLNQGKSGMMITSVVTRHGPIKSWRESFFSELDEGEK